MTCAHCGRVGTRAFVPLLPGSSSTYGPWRCRWEPACMRRWQATTAALAPAPAPVDLDAPAPPADPTWAPAPGIPLEVPVTDRVPDALPPHIMTAAQRCHSRLLDHGCDFGLLLTGIATWQVRYLLPAATAISINWDEQVQLLAVHAGDRTLWHVDTDPEEPPEGVPDSTWTAALDRIEWILHDALDSAGPHDLGWRPHTHADGWELELAVHPAGVDVRAADLAALDELAAATGGWHRPPGPAPEPAAPGSTNTTS